MAQDRRQDPTDIRGWPLGVNNVAPDYSMPDGSLRNGVNVDILDTGKIRRRKGFTEALAGVDVHSLWGTEDETGLYVEGDEFKQLRYVSGAWADTVLDTGFSGRRVWYVNLDGTTYYSNGQKTGKYHDGAISDWGVEDPAGAPTLSGSTGTMLAGRYQVAVTFLNASGEESGASVSSGYTLASDGGLFVSAIPQPQDADATEIRVYCTMPNGDVFYRVTELPAGMTSYLLAGVYPGIVLKTQFMRKFPACTHLDYSNGRIYGASGTDALYTEPLRYGLYVPDKNFFMHSAAVSVIKGVTDGVYIVADKTRFVQFDADGETPTQRVVLPYGAVSGTAGNFGQSTDVYWFSVEGLVIGKDGGVVQNNMSDVVAVDEYTEGAALYREQDGLSQVVCSLSGKGDASAFTCSDYAEAEVIRRSRS